MKYTLTNDIIFKNFFKNKKEHLKYLIENITKETINSENINYSETSYPGRNKDYKESILDISITVDNIKVNIEMQNIDNKDLIERFEFYLSKILVNETEKGIDYKSLSKIHGIYFVNDKYSKFNKLFTRIADCDTFKWKETNGLKYKYIINLKHIDTDKTAYGFTKEFKNYLKFMSLTDEEEMKKMARTQRSLEEAYQELKKLNADKELTYYALRRQIYESDQISARNRAREELENAKTEARIKALEEGFEQGIEQGIEKGIEQGIEKGIEKGIISTQIKTAKEMLNEHIDINIIHKCTKLPLNKIKSLSISLNKSINV